MNISLSMLRLSEFRLQRLSLQNLWGKLFSIGHIWVLMSLCIKMTINPVISILVNLLQLANQLDLININWALSSQNLQVCWSLNKIYNKKIQWVGFKGNMTKGSFKVTSERMDKMTQCIQNFQNKILSGRTRFLVKCVASTVS